MIIYQKNQVITLDYNGKAIRFQQGKNSLCICITDIAHALFLSGVNHWLNSINTTEEELGIITVSNEEKWTTYDKALEFAEFSSYKFFNWLTKEVTQMLIVENSVKQPIFISEKDHYLLKVIELGIKTAQANDDVLELDFYSLTLRQLTEKLIAE